MRILVLPLLFLPFPLHALDCAPAPKSSPMAALPGCVHGAPVRQGDLILVPRVCRLSVEGTGVPKHEVERRTVDVRNGETGARVAAVSLPMGPIAADQFVPGTVLPGEPPLLVYPTGIAAIDPRANRAEVSFEAQGKLVGAARLGDLLLVVEAQAPDKTFGNGSLALTVIDQEAGEVLGDLQVAGMALDALALRGTTGKGAELALVRQEKGKSVELVAPLRDAAGKSLVKKGALAGRVQPFTPAVATPPGCVLLPASSSALVARSLLTVRDGKLERDVPGGLSVVTTPATDACFAVGGLAQTGAEQTGMAWFDRAGKAQLQAVRCK